MVIHNKFCHFHRNSRFLLWNYFFFLTNRLIWLWKILTLDCWNLALRSRDLSFGGCSEAQFVSMVPSTVPLQRCIPVLIVILRCPCFLDSFLPTVSIFADFPAVFRKAIIRLHGHHSHWFLNGNNSHSFSKEILCNGRGTVSALHTAQAAPSQLGLPGCHQAFQDYSASGQNTSQQAN